MNASPYRFFGAAQRVVLPPFVLILAGVVLLVSYRCAPAPRATHSPTSAFKAPRQVMAGLSLVAPPRPFSSDPMVPITAIGGNWVAVIPYGFTRPGQPAVRYEPNGRQWWGERHEGCRVSIATAKAAGLRVMLKPQVYVPGSWIGDLNFNNPSDWAAWEQDYRAYLLPLVALADSLQVELLCIGTELRHSVRERPEFWRGLIQEVRQRFRGAVTYAANWDDYAEVPFWSELDYLGVNAYFPLVNAANPSLEQLLEAWQPIEQKLAAFAQQYRKPLLFTEYGYLSADGCTFENWNLEKKLATIPVNEAAQATALEALYTTFWNKPYWHGGFLWKWYPHEPRRPGERSKDYTPQDKLAAAVLNKWFHQTP